jgi:hypothetical protein
MLIVSREASQNARVTPIGCWAILSALHDILGHFNGGGCLMKPPDASISVPPLKAVNAAQFGAVISHRRL